MKIWLVTGDLHDRSSGPYSVVVNSAEEFVRQGHEVKIIGSELGNGSRNLKSDKESIDILAFNRCRFPGSFHLTLDLFRFLNDIEKDEHPDIVEIHGLWLANAWIIARFCVNNGIPYSIFVHGNLNKFALSVSKVKKTIVMPLAKHFIRNATYIQALNYAEHKEISSFLLTEINAKSTENVFTLSNGIVINDCTFSNKGKNNQGKFNILYLGRLHPIKNIESVFHALALDLPFDYHITIAGTGSNTYVQELQELTRKLSIDSKVTFYGFANESAKMKLYNESDLFLLCSHSEGQPVAALEALSNGVPLLLSNQCNIAERTPMIFLTNNSALSIRDGLVRTFNQLEFFSVKEARKYCLDNFSWESVISKKIKLWQGGK